MKSRVLKSSAIASAFIPLSALAHPYHELQFVQASAEESLSLTTMLMATFGVAALFLVCLLWRKWDWRAILLKKQKRQ